MERNAPNLMNRLVWRNAPNPDRLMDHLMKKRNAPKLDHLEGRNAPEFEPFGEAKCSKSGPFDEPLDGGAKCSKTEALEEA